jgi:dolichol-phosphate mannosyltransferase
MLSIILLSYYSGERIQQSYERLKAILDEHKIPFEYIVIDDGSTDHSFEIAEKLERTHHNVRAFQLSRNFTSHYSIFAGLSVCKGSCAIPIPDDEQQPYFTIVEMYELWKKGEQVIIPYRKNRKEKWLKVKTSNLYYNIMNRLSDVNYPYGGADTFMIDREVINIINNEIHPINTASITEVLRLGFNPYYFPYERPIGLNEHKSRWTFKKKIKLAKDTFFSSSSYPIKLITNLGLLTSLASFILLLFYVYIRLFGNDEFWGVAVPGWTSLVVLISFFSGLIILSLGIIAEYIWRIYEEVKARPGYIIKDKKSKFK